MRARIMHITRVLALLVVARARRRCSEYSMAMPWCGPRPLRNGTADAMRALAASHAWPGVEPGAIRVANVAAPGSNAEVGVATAPDGTRVAVRVGATSNRCRSWAACDAVERLAATAGCAPKVLFADETARLSEVVEPLRVRKAAEMPDAFGRLVACVHGSGRGVLDRVEPCADAAARALRERENESPDATERLRRAVARLLALGRSDLVETEVLHFDLNDRNIMRRELGNLVAIDFESVCAGAPALDLNRIFRRHRRATLGPASTRAARTAVIEAYVKTRGLPDKPIEDRLWDLEVANVLGLVLEPHGPLPPGDARSMDFADVLTDILEKTAGSPADREALIEIGVTETWFRQQCAARGAEWVDNKCCAQGRRAGRCK